MHHVASAEKHQRFGQRVVEHVIERADHAQRPAEAEAQRDHAHMLHTRIRRQPFDDGLAADEQRRHQQAEGAQNHQGGARHRFNGRALQNVQIAHDAQHGAVEQRAREHGRDRRRAFAVRIRQPGVHGGQAHLGAKTHQHQQERKHQQQGLGLGGDGGEIGPGHVVHRAEDEGAGPVKQHRAQQRQTQPGGDDDDVLPRRLDAFGRALKAHQKGADDGGEVDGDPVQARIVLRRGEEHGQRERRKQRIEAVQPRLLAVHPAHIADGVHAGQQIHHGQAEHHPHAEGVEQQVMVQRGDGLTGRGDEQHDDQHEVDDGRGEVERFGHATATRHPAPRHRQRGDDPDGI